MAAAVPAIIQRYERRMGDFSFKTEVPSEIPAETSSELKNVQFFDLSLTDVFKNGSKLKARRPVLRAGGTWQENKQTKKR